MPTEEYTLILKHEYVNGDQNYKIDEPIVMKMCVCLGDGSTAIDLNRMLDRFKHEVLQRESQWKQ